MSEAPLWSVSELVRTFPVAGKPGFVAVDRVSFDVAPGEALGIVGESGSGKSTLVRCMLRLIEPDSGTVRFQGRDLATLGTAELRSWRRDVAMVFQDPVGALNPRMRVGTIVGEPLVVHRLARGRDLRSRVGAILEQCGLAATDAERFPHEFSGGQRQRIGIARALITEPRCLVCDEPTSALDVSVQARILNLLQDLRRERDLSILFISHDLAVVHHLCDSILVMKNGRIVERGSADSVVHEPQEPYTRQLVGAAMELETIRDES